MVGAPNTGSQDQGSAPRRLRRLALCMSVMGASLLSLAGLAVGQAPDTRLQAPIGHRQPRPSDLPPDVQRDEQFDAQATQTQPQKQTPDRRSSAGSVPTIDVGKGCEAAEKAIGSIFGPNNGASLGSCLKQEQEARQVMINSWTKYPASDRQKCIDTTVYNPSYVEWLTCLEMYRDVRSLNRETTSVGAGTR